MAAADESWLVDLARSILDGHSIDWREIESGKAAEEERGVLAGLKQIARVAEAHRKQQESSGSVNLSKMHTLDDGTPPPAEPLPAWGPLEVIERVGEGSFGEVYRAKDPRLEREVALKVLREDHSLRQDVASAVLNEGRLLARVRHPNVATVYGVEQHEGRIGLWMEFIRGQTLAELSRRQGKLGAQEAGMIGLDLCRALAAVHQAGLIHRDIKPHNVMREEGGRIVLTDFGAGRDLLAMSSDPDRSVSGTPLYMAPEVLNGAPATQQSDIYSLGVLLFHLLTGSYPAKAATLRELRDVHARRAHVPLGELRPDVPPSFLRAIDRALAHDPSDRFSGAATMEQALAAALGVERDEVEARRAESPRGGLRSRRFLFALAASIALSGAAVAWLARSGLLFRPAHEASDPGEVMTRPPLPDPLATDASARSGLNSSPKGSIPAATSEAAYTVEAAFFAGTAVRERLSPDKRIRVGEALSLDFKASRELFVYVLNEDDHGTSVLLFPIPGGALGNPLAPGVTHRLPGQRDGKPTYWQVTSAGGREHFLVLASPERLTDFERETLGLIRPAEGVQVAYAPVPESARLHLRGVTGLLSAPGGEAAGATGHLFEQAAELTPQAQTVNGVWLRRMDFDNPPL